MAHDLSAAYRSSVAKTVFDIKKNMNMNIQNNTSKWIRYCLNSVLHQKMRVAEPIPYWSKQYQSKFIQMICTCSSHGYGNFGCTKFKFKWRYSVFFSSFFIDFVWESWNWVLIQCTSRSQLFDDDCNSFEWIRFSSLRTMSNCDEQIRKKGLNSLELAAILISSFSRLSSIQFLSCSCEFLVSTERWKTFFFLSFDIIVCMYQGNINKFSK